MTRYSPDKTASLHPCHQIPRSQHSWRCERRCMMEGISSRSGRRQPCRSWTRTCWAREKQRCWRRRRTASVVSATSTLWSASTISITHALSSHHRTNQCFCTRKDHWDRWTRVDLRQRPHNLPLFSELEAVARWWRRQRGGCPERWDEKPIGFAFFPGVFFVRNPLFLSPKIQLAHRHQRCNQSIPSVVNARHIMLQIELGLAPYARRGAINEAAVFLFFAREWGNHGIFSVVNAREGMWQIEPGSDPDACCNILEFFVGRLAMQNVNFKILIYNWGHN
jgi:hypothetical protein